MSITKKERELAAVGISIAAGCKPCADYHMKAARAAEATKNEIQQAIMDAISVRAAAADVMREYGLAHLGMPRQNLSLASPRDRAAELVCLGAAFAVNCVSNLDHYIGAAADVGVAKDDILAIAKLAKIIKGEGASHVDHRVDFLAREAVA